ncbi:MAG TPA: OmpA family protein [Kofleriaceae bacterium]|nr:OmpA family protein [Kofleriaceae bacterium]
MKALSLVAILSASPALADGWLVAETPAAVAVTDAQAGMFRPGVMPAVGAYVDNGWFALGIRLRAGVLRDGAAPMNHLRDPGFGGLTTASVAARLLALGGWVEGAIGGGMTGDDLVPAMEIGAGWAFPVSGFEMGPSIRFARVTNNDDMATLGTADLVLVGIDMRFGRAHEKRPRRTHHIPTPVAPTREVAYAIDRDRDRIVEREPSCAEVVDGCTFGEITVVDDRIILDERVFFDLDRARVRSQGRNIIQAIASLWSEHPDWTAMTIEGHADVRGNDAYNDTLSKRRAERVRDVLVGAFPGAQVDAKGYGRSRPRDAGKTEAAHQRNRRVEFVIHRQREEFR